MMERSPLMDQKGYMRALEDAYRRFAAVGSERTV